MANGAFHTFDEFSWNSTQSASVQRANAQSALDSGEPLLMPCGETVTIDDVGLTISNPTHLVGHGCDIRNTGNALSQFRTGAANSDILRVLAHNTVLEGFGVHADAAGGRGIVVGDASTHLPDGVRLTGLSSCTNFAVGCDDISGNELTSFDCHWKANGGGTAYRFNNINPGVGDSRIIAGSMYAPGGTGLGILGGGGGIYLSGGTKFNTCHNHIKMDENTAPGGGSFMATGINFEDCESYVSCLFNGSVYFERIGFVGCQWANVSTAVQTTGAAVWLHKLLLASNIVKVMGPPLLSGFDIEAADGLMIDGNDIDCTGQAYTGMIVRGLCKGTIGTNLIRNVAAGYLPIYNLAGPNVTVAPFQG